MKRFRRRSGAQALSGAEIIGGLFQRRQAVFPPVGDSENQGGVTAFRVVDARLKPAVDVGFIDDFLEVAAVFAAVGIRKVAVGPSLRGGIADEFVDQAFLELDFMVWLVVK